MPRSKTATGPNPQTIEQRERELLDQPQFRELTIRADGEEPNAAIDEEARTVEIAISSEEPYERLLGIEILGHQPGEVRLERLTNHAPMLYQHDPDRQIGVILPDTVSLDADRVLRATVKFSRSPLGEEIFTDIKDGIRRKVSVGYHVINIEWETDEKGNRLERYRVTDWMPYESSIVSVAADDQVGVGRAGTPAPGEAKSDSQPPDDGVPGDVNQQGDIDARRKEVLVIKDKPEDQGVETPETAPKAETKSDPPVDIEQVKLSAADEARQAEQQRVAEIESVRATYGDGRTDIQEVCKRAIIDGQSLVDFRNAYIKILETKPVKPASQIGMSRGEISKFSLMRLVRHLAKDKGLASGLDDCDAGYEIECGEEALKQARAYGTDIESRGGVFLPWEIQQALSGRRTHQRLLGAETATEGEEFVPEQLLSGQTIFPLDAQRAVRTLGATVIPNLRGTISIPKVGTRTVFGHEPEGDDVPTGQPVTTEVTLAPKHMGAFVPVSFLGLKQSAPAFDQLVMADAMVSIYNLEDVTAVNGGGTDEPDGILQTTGIGDISLGATVGGAPTLAKILEILATVGIANVNPGRLRWLTNYKGALAMNVVELDSGSGKFLLNVKDDLRADGLYNFYGGPLMISNNVPYDLVEGGASDLSAIIAGDFSQLIIGEWGMVEVIPQRMHKEGGVEIGFHKAYDLAVRHAAAFAATQDCDTAAVLA